MLNSSKNKKLTVAVFVCFHEPQLIILGKIFTSFPGQFTPFVRSFAVAIKSMDQIVINMAAILSPLLLVNDGPVRALV